MSLVNAHSDSGIDDASSATSSDSVLLEAKDYVESNDRKYHADWIPRRYILPNDSLERERLELQHQILLSIDGLHKANLPKELQNVLDIGTGTGEWAIEIAEKYPGAIVTGLDISPNIMPTSTVPNCSFYVEDAEDGIRRGRVTYDFVNARLLNGVHDWPRLVANIFEALAPGGYVEIKEFEFPLEFHDPEIARAPNCALKTWSTTVIEGARKLGIDLTISACLAGILKDAGFEHCERSVSIWPIGTWPKKKVRKRLGTWLLRFWSETLTAFAWRPFIEMGWREEEVHCLLAKVRNELSEGRIRASMHVRTFWARKPLQ